MRPLLFLLALILTACTTLAPPRAGPLVSRTTQGGPPLSWNLKIYNPTKTALLHEFSNLAPGGLDGGFRWQLQPWGDTVRLEFAGRNDHLGVPPLGIVALTVDGDPAFYGTTPDTPSLLSPDVETVTVDGGREILRRYLSDQKVYGPQGIFVTVRDLLSRRAPALALSYNPAMIGDGTGTDAGPTLDVWYMPDAPLTDVLDELAKRAGVPWGVSTSGVIFFGRPSPAPLNVAYAGQPWTRLPVQGRETVTRATVRIATTLAGVEQVAWSDHGLYLPASVTKTAQHAQHSVYQASAVLEPPEGTPLVLREAFEQVQTAPGSTITGAGNAIDADPATYATVPPSQTLVLNYPTAAPKRRIGVEVTHAGTLRTRVEVLYRQAGAPDQVLTFDLSTGQGISVSRFILPPPAGSGINPELPWDYLVQLVTFPTFESPAPNLWVYDIRALTVDEAAALNVATAALAVPHATPAQITLDGLIPPTTEVTVTGSPDGDVTGAAALFEYEHQPNAVYTTKVRVGSSGQNKAVRALKLAVRP